MTKAEIATQKRRAKQDYRIKIKLERPLSRQMIRLFNEIKKQSQANYVKTGEIITTSLFLSQLYALLSSHHIKVANVFKERAFTNEPLPPQNQGELERLIVQSAVLRAQQSSQQITATLQDDLNQAFTDAQQPDEATRSRRKIAMLAGLAFARSSFNRARITIPITETQTAAENTKYLVANTHHQVTTVQTLKVWHTVGDNKVRPAHASTDLQEQLITTPFNVGGEPMQWPQDASLGASLGNIINCRCSAQYTFR